MTDKRRSELCDLLVLGEGSGIPPSDKVLREDTDDGGRSYTGVDTDRLKVGAIISQCHRQQSRKCLDLPCNTSIG